VLDALNKGILLTFLLTYTAYSTTLAWRDATYRQLQSSSSSSSSSNEYYLGGIIALLLQDQRTKWRSSGSDSSNCQHPYTISAAQ